MPILPPTIAARDLPGLRAAFQSFPHPRIGDVYGRAYAEAATRLDELNTHPGARVAIGVGSRGIRGLVPVVQATGAVVRIKNTLHLDTIWVSDALADAVAAHPSLSIVE